MGEGGRVRVVGGSVPPCSALRSSAAAGSLDAHPQQQVLGVAWPHLQLPACEQGIRNPGVKCLPFTPACQRGGGREWGSSQHLPPLPVSGQPHRHLISADELARIRCKEPHLRGNRLTSSSAVRMSCVAQPSHRLLPHGSWKAACRLLLPAAKASRQARQLQLAERRRVVRWRGWQGGQTGRNKHGDETAGWAG
jgi:hypothetical protein